MLMDPTAGNDGAEQQEGIQLTTNKANTRQINLAPYIVSNNPSVE